MHIKRAWYFLVFIGCSEVLDYLHHPITTYKPTPTAGAALLFPGGVVKVSRFQNNQISSFRFFLFYDVHTKSMRYASLAVVLVNTYLKRSAWVPVLMKSNVSCWSSCRQQSNQSGRMWHSHSSLRLPTNLCAWYFCGSVPVACNRSMASSNKDRSRPRLTQSFTSFVKRLV